uniref:Hsp70-binding protein 1 n=2 Tax=Anthurium amnicola TaxID=1678845 RepID=A0A1D1XPV7_9ARAE
MLDELQEHVESVDMANDLHSIGGLVPLLDYLKSSNPGIRAKSAEVVSTIVQNNPKSQQLVMDANGMEPLLSNFNSDSDATVRTKALGAISSLIRDNEPGIAAFRLADGYTALRDALGSEDAKLQRKALNLIQYLLHENNSDCRIAAELGLPPLMVHLTSSDNSEVREAALQGLLELARAGTLGNSTGLAEDDKLKKVLQNRILGISEMSPEDLRAAREERELVDSLWSACYNEPSPLKEKGLVLLPGEDEPLQPPDVAGKLFEPPLRAWAAKPASDGPGDNEENLLLGLRPVTVSPSGSNKGVEAPKTPHK